MGYESLAAAFHKDRPSERFARNERLARERLRADSTFRTGIQTEHGELFLAVPRELSLLNERVLRRERKVSKELAALPPIARGSLIMSLIVDEVVSSNELEGVYSTRRQISELLERGADDADDLNQRRFREFAHLYLELSEPEVSVPTRPEQIRAIYDRVMRGEKLGGDAPDGTLFRRGPVDIYDATGRVIHSGLQPERVITEAMERMLSLANSEEIPQTYSAILAHFVFEYVHPFYDGNGRTGRYLLALFLSQPLSLLTSLSLSRGIAEHKSRYYRSFKEAEHPLNHGELTAFVMNLLENVGRAQEELLVRLGERREQLAAAEDALAELVGEHDLDDTDKNLLYVLTQQALFGAFPEVVRQEAGDVLGLGATATARRARRLAELGLVEVTRQRPPRLLLTPAARERLGLGSS